MGGLEGDRRRIELLGDTKGERGEREETSKAGYGRKNDG